MEGQVKKVYVGNVPEQVRRAELRELFARFGNIDECDIVRDYAFIVSNI